MSWWLAVLLGLAVAWGLVTVALLALVIVHRFRSNEERARAMRYERIMDRIGERIAGDGHP